MTATTTPATDTTTTTNTVATTPAAATTATAIAYLRDAAGVVTLVLDDPVSSVNTMNDAFMAGLEECVPRLEAERDEITGVLLVSAKKTFFAGGDLNRLRAGSADRAAEETAYIDRMKGWMRRLEKLGRPVVAVLNGTALGGGLEVALCAHHRIAVDLPGSRFGLPEVGLGLLPGGGGITRTVRMFGLHKALSDIVLSARKFDPREALAAGLVDDVAPDAEEAEARARAWIAGHPDASQPWDVMGFRLPGGEVGSPEIAGTLPALSGLLRKR
ncbi:enoyl-CoA hydratase/isomerase family protein, partial [Streptomyces sp. NPDC055051]